jgi:hypothetical protein
VVEAGGGCWWWCGVVLGRGWCLVVGRVCGGYPSKFDLRKRALRREPCPGSNFRRFFSIFFFLFFLFNASAKYMVLCTRTKRYLRYTTYF